MRIIPLTQNKVTCVDDIDFALLSRYKWRAHFSRDSQSWYATTTILLGVMKVPRVVQMARAILKAPRGLVVDHENHNTLDNRRKNLRITTHQGNHQNTKRQKNNTSGHCGVYWDKQTRRWRVRIKIRGKMLCFGRFVNKEEAIAKRQEVESLYGFHSNHGRIYD